MAMIKEGWADLLEPGIREWFFTGFSRRASLIDTLFDVQGSTKDAEHFRGKGAISPDAWNQFANTKRPAQVSFDQGYKKTFRHTTFLVELPIEVELLEDSQYADVIDSTTELGDSAALKRETDAASIFNNAFSASYTGADAVALCSDSHPNGPDASGTQDNNFALPLSKANVSTVRQAMEAFKDDKGGLIACTPKVLLVPPALAETAFEIAMSDKDPNSANNTANFNFGKWEVYTWHYLTDTNAWFMIDPILMKQSLKWFNRVPVNIRPKNVDDPAFVYFTARMRYSYGWKDWRWVAGSNPS